MRKRIANGGWRMAGTASHVVVAAPNVFLSKPDYRATLSGAATSYARARALPTISYPPSAIRFEA